ncbi:MAG: PKD domain-containing protein [Candidatus Methanofastidiosia archaeon]
MKNRRKRSVLFLVLILSLPMFSFLGINQVGAYADLRVALLPTQGTVSPGSPLNVQVTYINVGDVDLDLKLAVYDCGTQEFSPRPTLIYKGTRYTTVIDEWLIFGTMSLPIGQTKTITVTFEVSPEMINDVYCTILGGWHQREGDTFWGSDAKNFDLTVEGCTPENVQPTAVITSPSDGSVYNVGDTVTLDGSASFDTDGAIVSYSWSSSIDGALSDQATFSTTSLSAGNHVITLAVTDDDGASDSELINVRINELPRAIANLAGIVGQFEIGATVSFDGTRSSDDGSIVSYSWSSNIDGFLSNQPYFSTNTLSLGRHTVTLTVTDDDGASDSDYEIVKIVPHNDPPVAYAGPDRTAYIGESGNVTVILDGRGSRDDKGIVSYSWRGSGGLLDPIPGKTGPVVNYIFTASGVYGITLTVTDEEGESDSDEVVITVERRVKPTAIFITSPGGHYYNFGEKITFDGSPSYDPDGTIIRYSWSSSRDGHLSNSSKFSTSSLSKGWHQITLEVTDDKRNKGYAREDLVIESGSVSNADLIVQNIDVKVTKQNTDNSFTVNITAEIVNNGPVDVDWVEVLFSYDYPARGWIGSEFVSVDSLGRVEASIQWTASAGEYDLVVEVDPGNLVEEENDNNNRKNQHVNLGEFLNYSIPLDINGDSRPDMYYPVAYPDYVFEIGFDQFFFTNVYPPYGVWDAASSTKLLNWTDKAGDIYKLEFEWFDVYRTRDDQFDSSPYFYFEAKIVDSCTEKPVTLTNVWKQAGYSDIERKKKMIREEIAVDVVLHIYAGPFGWLMSLLTISNLVIEGDIYTQYYFVGRTDDEGRIRLPYDSATLIENYFVDFDKEVKIGTNGPKPRQINVNKYWYHVYVRKEEVEEFIKPIESGTIEIRFNEPIAKYICSCCSMRGNKNVLYPQHKQSDILKEESIKAFTHNFQDQGVDEDGDGFFDMLSVDVEVNVSQSGRYSISADLVGYYEDPISYAVTYKDLKAGNQIITLYFDGQDINQSAIDGPYRLSYLGLHDSEGNLIDLEEKIYLTASYSYSDFQKPYVVFNNNYADYGVDTNGNGLYDNLTIEIGLDVNKGGTYTIQGKLHDSNGCYIDYSTEEVFLNIGSQTASLEFDGSKINQNGFVGPLILRDVVISNEQQEIVGQKGYACETSSDYGFDQFEIPMVRLNDIKGDYGKDTNNNGKYEYLTAEVAVYVRNEDDYIVTGFLYSTSGRFISKTSTITYLRNGIQIVKLDFNGGDINESGENGPYMIGYLEVCDLENNLISKISLNYQTMDNQFEDFEQIIHVKKQAEGNSVDFNKLIRALASNMISKAESLQNEMNELLEDAKKEKLDTSACELILEEALNSLEKAKNFYAGGNYIAANNFALEAIEEFKEAIKCLRELLGK